MKQNMLQKLRKSKGFTLIEILLVVGFIALAGIAAYITYPKVQATNRANTEATNINTIAAGVKNVYAGANTFTGLTEAALITGQQVPTTMINGTTLTNSFGGVVTVAPATLAGGTANGSFAITYKNVPIAECVKLATGVGNNFVNVNVAGTDVKKFPATTPVDVASAITSCAGGAVTLIFTQI